MIIKIDIDGVIRDMMTPVLSIYNKYFPRQQKVYEDITEYNLDKCMPQFMGKGAYICFELNSKLVFQDALPYSEVYDALNTLKQQGHTIILVTYQRTYENKVHTLNFLQKWGLPYDSIIFTRDKYLVTGDVLIEDNPYYLEDPKEKSTVICINHPYNQNISPSIPRYDSLYQAIQHLN